MSQSRGLVAGVTAQWPRLLTVGILDVLVGVVALAWPGVTVAALAILFGLFLLLSGIVAVSISWRTRSVVGLVLGVLAIVAAIICFVHPGAGVVAILLGCALWFFMLGLVYLGAAFAGARDRLWWAVLGVLSLIASVIMIASPGVAISTVALLVGIAFLIRGGGELALAWRMRGMHRGVTS